MGSGHTAQCGDRTADLHPATAQEDRERARRNAGQDVQGGPRHQLRRLPAAGGSRRQRSAGVRASVGRRQCRPGAGGRPRRRRVAVRALGLWSGEALADVPVGPVLGLDLVGMEEAGMRTLEQRIEADLSIGRHAGIVAELRMLVARFPMQESLVAQLMLALYRSGSTWRALESFQRLRSTLVEELGIEPSARLQELHGRMLAGCATLDLPEPAGYGVPARLSA
ncbi:AfsR/SARP family transcriptional regulator [Streptomyces sp. L7]